MSGLDKIIAQILADAQTEADQLLKQAKEEAELILETEQEKIQTLKQEAKQAEERKRKTSLERIKSSAALRHRQAVLREKQEMIARVLKKAYEAVLSKEEDAYFELLAGLLDRFVLAKAGEIYFSRRDLDRMPQAFRDEIERIAQKKGGSLLLQTEPKPIDGGFVLVYGGVEENCSIQALFSEQKEKLSDQAYALLFE